MKQRTNTNCAVSCLFVFLLGGCLVGCGAKSHSQLQPAVSKPVLPTTKQKDELHSYFELAFGKPESTSIEISNETVVFKPGRLVGTSFGSVLISEGEVQNPAHASSGKLALHYFSVDRNIPVLKRSFVPAIELGSFGKLSAWKINNELSSTPILIAEGGGTWQGYVCSYSVVVELGPQGPVQQVIIQTHFSDDGAVESGAEETYDGNIVNIIKDQSFDVEYSGTRKFLEHYVRMGDRYVIKEEKSQVPDC